jgi:GTP cyclohydrolase IA
MRKLTSLECRRAATLMEPDIAMPSSGVLKIYGVPRGGVPVAYLLAAVVSPFYTATVIEDPMMADVIVDDIIDSGATQEKYRTLYPHTPFLALADYLEEVEPNNVVYANGLPRTKDWLVFPWEESEEGSASDIVLRLLQYIGEDPKREGLIETPTRVLKAWREWTSGYSKNPMTVLKCFEDGGENYDEMVMVKDLPFYSHCEHHLAPFFGSVTIGYIPHKKIVGLSKLGRIVDIYAKRLQVQERMTWQIADAIHQGLEPQGVGVVVKARHLCMESRGLHTQGHYTITSKLLGAFFADHRARTEFIGLAT